MLILSVDIEDGMNSRRIKVLRVVTSPQCVSWHMGKSLVYLSNDFEVLVAGDNVSINADEFPGISWADIPIARKIDFWLDLKAVILLYKLCRDYKPDIVHSIMPKAGLLAAIGARLAGVPVRVHTFTGQVWDTKKGLSRLLLRLIDKFIVFINTACLTDSPSQSIHLYENGISDCERPLTVLGKGSLIGVDLDRFNRNRIQRVSKISRESLGLSESDFVVSYIARKSKDKGALDVLHAFSSARKKVSSLRLLFIGPDESDGAIERLKIKEPEIFVDVIDLGLVKNHEEYLLVSDVLCMPSYREGFGSIVIDAAALGVPCIGSRISGLVDSISDGKSGILFTAGDIVELEKIIVRLESDRKLLSIMGRAATERVKNYFSSQILYHHLRNFYESQL